MVAIVSLPFATLLTLPVLVACVNVSTIASPRTFARYYLPEMTQQQYPKLVIQQFESLGISQFQPADGKASWKKLLSDSASFDIVWSVNALPPSAELELPYEFHAKVNRLPGADKLISLDALNQHFSTLQKEHGKYFYDFVPGHFELPRDKAQLTNAYKEVHKKSISSPKREYDPHVYQRFLLRERTANGDNDSTKFAEVFVTNADLQSKLQSSVFKGKAVVVDQYVEPLLLDNHKFRIGFYVVVTCIDPLRVYVYDHPLIQIAKVEYPSEVGIDTDPAVYNFVQYDAPWDFPDLQKEFEELPSATREGSNAWHIVKRYLRKEGIDTKHLQDEVDAAIAKVILSNRSNLQNEQAKIKRSDTRKPEQERFSDPSDSFFEMWKFNFELDDMGKPWLVGVASNPSMEATQSVLATDEAIKKRLLHDLINLVGVHPQARLPFEKFFRPADAGFCSDKCRDKNRVWDSTCWSCPGWFTPNVAQKLFAATTEYARRGSFNLVFPSLEQELSKYLDTALSEYDIAFNRYLGSFSSGYMEMFSASDHTVLCVYREHCSNHGDCVNGVCSCDQNYEGRTCYIPKDLDQEEHIQQETADTGGLDTETWKEMVQNLVWKRNRPVTGTEDTSASSTVMILVIFGVLLFVIHRIYISRRPGAGNVLNRDGKAM